MVGLINWMMKRTMLSEVRRVAKMVTPLYYECKSRKPKANEAEVIKDIALSLFGKEQLARLSENTMKQSDKFFETIQGLCYIMALNLGVVLKNTTKLRALQFTHYMDKELEDKGFPRQSKEQKEHNLEVMGLRIDGWEEITGDY